MEEIVKVIKIETGSSQRSINSLKADIKNLTKELNSLTIGSERYNQVQKDLITRQTQLKEINSSMRIQTRTIQQDLVNLQKFATGLTSGFAALTGVLALVGNDSEDFNKTIQKLTASLTVLNAVGGLKNLVESFPGLKESFTTLGNQIKNFFTGAVNSFDPLERRLTQAANNLSNIGNIDIKADIKTSGGGNQIVTTNTDLANQQKTIIPLNEQWNKYNEELKLATQAAGEYSTDLQKLRNIFQEYNKTVPGAVVPLKEFDKAAGDLVKGNLEPMKKFFDQLVLDQDSLTQVAKKMGVSYDQLAKGLENFSSNVQEDSEYVAELKKNLEDVEAAGGKAVTGLKKAGNIFKSVFSTAVWTVVISAVVGLIYKIIDYTKELNKATKAQKLFNQEVNKTASELSGSVLAKFYELQKAYSKLGDAAKDKEQFLKDYNSQLKETGLKITDVQSAEDAFINNTDKYKQAIIARAKIDAYREQITKKTQEYIANTLELDRQLESGEWKKLTAAQRSQLAGISSTGSQYGTSTPTDRQLAQREEAIVEYRQENLRKLSEQREKYTSEYDKFVNDILDKTQNLEARYSHLWADTGETASKQIVREVKENLPDINAILDPIMEEINRFFEAESDVLLGDKDKELLDLENNWFKPYLELYKEYGGDVESLLEEYERRKKAIIDKYKPTIDYDGELTKIKELYDFQTRQLTKYAPKTDYKQFGYTFQYQSGKDVDTEYDNTVEYNNKLYEFTAQRINSENELLNKQLENTELTADEKLKIERRLADNEKELQDAADKRDDDNTTAAIDRQKKRLQAFQATAQVTSSILGSLGSIYDTKAQTAKSEKEMKKASQTAKGFKAAQAVIDALSAANGAYSSMASIPYVGPGLGAAAAAAALIAGYANVKSILAQDVTGSSIQNVSANVPSASTPNISYTKELLGDKELDVVNQPIKCYVLESDITSTQNKIKTQVTNSTF